MTRDHQTSDAEGSVAVGCPDPNLLVAFASGGLSEHEAFHVGDHVSQCETCESAVRTLSAARPAAPIQGPNSLPEFEGAQAASLAGEFVTTATEWDVSTGESCFAAPRPSVLPTVALSPSLPAKIGRYRVKSELGRGGFGAVYLAHDADLDRPVAIKVPRFDVPVSGETLQSFLEEARTAARLKHPGIVAVHEIARQADASHFIVMEYVEGQSLASEIAKRKLTQQQAVQIVAQAAAAVHYAHKKGLVHRDLKPGNILLDADGEVKIADFGLALHENEQRSRGGEFAGTPAFMSPEQIRRDTHRLDGRSDIWALGVILYELLTGKRPFNGTPEQTADEVLHRSPKPLRQIQDDIDPVLETICLKCLAKDPDQRYSSCKDLADALNRWQQGKPQKAPRRSRLIRWSAVALALAGCAAAAAAIIPGLSGRRDAPYLVDLAAEPLMPLKLMDRPPEEIFPLDAPDQRWERRAQPPQIHVESNTSVFLGLGTTASDLYSLRVETSKVAPVGYASLFFGFQDAPRENGLRRWRCQALSIHRNPGGAPYVVREVLRIHESPSGSWSLIRDYRGEVRIDDLPLDGATLEVTIRGGRVASVQAGGRLLRQLSDPAQGELDLPTKGRFGVVNSRGSTLFRDALFTSLKPKAIP